MSCKYFAKKIADILFACDYPTSVEALGAVFGAVLWYLSPSTNLPQSVTPTKFQYLELGALSLPLKGQIAEFFKNGCQIPLQVKPYKG